MFASTCSFTKNDSLFMAYHPYHFVGEVLLHPVYMYVYIYIYIYIYIWRGKQREATARIQSLIKLQPWFLSLRWKTCHRQNCSLGSCACSVRPALGQNTLMIYTYDRLFGIAVSMSDYHPRGPVFDSQLYPRMFSGSIGSETGSTQPREDNWVAIWCEK